MIYLKSSREIGKLREAGRVVAGALGLVAKAIGPGVTTGDLERIVEDYVRPLGGELIFKGYRGFPGSICTSVNDEVVHGIPGDRKLLDGDIVSVDIGIRYDGYIGDSARTFPVGKVSLEARKLLEVCERALEVGIENARPGNKLSVLSYSIQKYVEEEGFSVVRDYTGHGVGKEMHEEPQVPNFVDQNTRRNDRVLKPGLVIAIEPMVNAGGYRVEKVVKDGWEVVVTRDSRLSAHFEHTVAITENGPVILTLP